MEKTEPNYGLKCFECGGTKRHENTISCIKCASTRRTRTRVPVCPHCESEKFGGLYYGDNIYCCDDCGKDFTVKTETVTYYSTEPLLTQNLNSKNDNLTTCQKLEDSI